MIVVTGDLYNAGSDCNAYITIYGERGDTGPRDLRHRDGGSFKKGQEEIFRIEAVHLGPLKRIIIGPDGSTPGN